MLGVEGSWSGLADDRVRPLSWSDVEGWAFKGGAELGTKRDIPPVEQFYALGRAIERNEIDALIVIGGLNAYLGVHAITSEKDRYPAFQIPMLLIPASAPTRRSTTPRGRSTGSRRAPPLPSAALSRRRWGAAADT